MAMSTPAPDELSLDIDSAIFSSFSRTDFPNRIFRIVVFPAHWGPTVTYNVPFDDAVSPIAPGVEDRDFLLEE
jgi:hypothetical protein